MDGEFPALRRLIEALGSVPKGRSAQIQLPDGARVEVPSSLLPVIERAAEEMANGLPVAILSADAELTVEEASELLDEAPETVSELVGSGKIPHQVITERRLRLRDVLRYRRGQRGALVAVPRVRADRGQTVHPRHVTAKARETLCSLGELRGALSSSPQAGICTRWLSQVR